MKRVCQLFLVFWFLPISIYSQQQLQPGASLTEVIQEIQKGLQKTQNLLQSVDIPGLKEVEVAMETVYASMSGYKFKFLVFTFGQEWSKEMSQQTIINLVPPRPDSQFAALAEKTTVSDQLVDALVAAARGIHFARSDSAEIPLETNSLEINLKFIVKETGGSVATFQIAPLDVSLSGDLSKKAIHSIRVRFEDSSE